MRRVRQKLLKAAFPASTRSQLRRIRKRFNYARQWTTDAGTADKKMAKHRARAAYRIRKKNRETLAIMVMRAAQ